MRVSINRCVGGSLGLAVLLLAGCGRGAATQAVDPPLNADVMVHSGSVTFARIAVPGFTGPIAIAAGTPLHPIGMANDGAGNLSVLDQTILGLQGLYLQPRVAYDVVTADFNGDGIPDALSTVYSPTNVNSQAYLYLGRADGTFTQNTAFGSQYVLNPDGPGFRGRTETAVVADFNNDGTVDIFLPTYTYLDSIHDLSGDARFVSSGPAPNVYNARQSFLLLNDGSGNFTEHAVEAGVSMHAAISGIPALSTDPEGNQPEGVQAVDFNMDGLIDLYAGGHLFINQGVDAQGVPHFKDMAPAWGLTQAVLHGPPPWDPNDRIPDNWLVTDEGAKFLDWNNDGHLDLLLFRWNWGPAHGPRLFEFDGTQFRERVYAPTSPTPTCPYSSGRPDMLLFVSSRPFTSLGTAAGINAYDLDNDGLEDVLVSGDATGSAIFHNNGCQFVEIPAGDLGGRPGGAGAMALADLNGDGLIDVIYPEATTHAYYINTTSTRSPSSFTVEVLGPNGEHNQYGRVIQVFPPGTPQIFTRVVDGGSGYLSQNQYPILVGTPFSGPHSVKVYFAPLAKCVYGGPPCKPAVLTFSIAPGQRAQAYAPSPAYPTGRSVIGPGP